MVNSRYCTSSTNGGGSIIGTARAAAGSRPARPIRDAAANVRTVDVPDGA